MTFDPGMPMVPEAAIFALAVLVLLVGLLRKPSALATDPGSRPPTGSGRPEALEGRIPDPQHGR